MKFVCSLMLILSMVSAPAFAKPLPNCADARKSDLAKMQALIQILEEVQLVMVSVESSVKEVDSIKSRYDARQISDQEAIRLITIEQNKIDAQNKRIDEIKALQDCIG